jgi:divalent metal cation (Fe/Co/Zn/Cd) transporter
MIDQLFTRLAATIASFLAATLVVIAAFGFLCYAAYLALLEIASPPLAALGAGLGALAFAILIVLVGRLPGRARRNRARRRDTDEDAGDARTLAGELGGTLGVQLGAVTRAHTPTVLTVSLLAGVAVGASPRLRKLLLDLVLPR